MTGLITAFIGLPRWLRAVLGALAILGALWGLVSVYDWYVIARYQDKVEAQSAKARGVADAERAADIEINTRNEEQAHAAINTATDGAPAAAALAHNCQRLRKLGRVPPACRPASGGGSEAGTR